ncbi:MAG: galactose oxidase-like domain-containing protein [Actinomycetota bacterium]
MLPRTMRTPARRCLATLVVVATSGLVLAVPGAAPAQSPPGPEVAGAWTAPFEEGGEGTPRCVTIEQDGLQRIRCKPAAVHTAMLPNGKVLYYNGLESEENVQFGIVGEGAELRDSLARVLDLTQGIPQWEVPTPETGAASNPLVEAGRTSGLHDPLGMLGVPGRPGDGFVGSLAGSLGIPPGNPAAPPDDPERNDGDLFCTDLTMLADGRILIAGGTDWYIEPEILNRTEHGIHLGLTELEGLRSSQIFDPATNTFTSVGDMKFGRWYPELVVLPDGKVLAAGGVTKLIKATQLGNVRRTETYDPSTNAWTENYTGPQSENSLPTSARLHLTPNSKVFYAGTGQTFDPNGQAIDEAMWALQQFFDPATGTWQVTGVAPLGARGGASEVALPMGPPYDTMRILSFGGTLGPSPSTYVGVPLATITTVDKAGTVRNEMAANMNRGRWFPSGVALPDGTVFAVNGGDKDGVLLPGTEAPIHTPEIYDPESDTWTDMAPAQRDRTYHNSALLLPDGRVLVGGHHPIAALYGAVHDLMPGVLANNDSDSSFEIFSPPYLFRGERPVVSEVQSGVAWGSSFEIVTPQAGDIESVTLMRLPSPQHVNDSDQRTLRLAFEADGDRLRAVAPPDGVAAPPGYYYLFVNRSSDKGPIPSVARIVRVGGEADLTPAARVLPDDAAAPAGGSATPTDDSSYLARPPALPLGVQPAAISEALATMAKESAFRLGRLAARDDVGSAVRRGPAPG